MAEYRLVYSMRLFSLYNLLYNNLSIINRNQAIIPSFKEKTRFTIVRNKINLWKPQSFRTEQFVKKNYWTANDQHGNNRQQSMLTHIYCTRFHNSTPLKDNCIIILD